MYMVIRLVSDSHNTNTTDVLYVEGDGEHVTLAVGGMDYLFDSDRRVEVDAAELLHCLNALAAIAKAKEVR